MFIEPGEEFHHYAGAEAFIEDIPMPHGQTARYLKFRINTVVVTNGNAPGCTQWVFIPVDDVDQLSAQLAAMAVSAKRWVPGQQFDVVGENIGVLNTTGSKV